MRDEADIYRVLIFIITTLLIVMLIPTGMLF